MSNNQTGSEQPDSILDNGDYSSHVVLSNIPSSNDVLRRRQSKGVPPARSNQRKAPAPPKSPKRIPQWLWIIIAKSLGIKTTPNEKPYLSSILHLITLGSAGCKLHYLSLYCLNNLQYFPFTLAENILMILNIFFF